MYEKPNLVDISDRSPNQKLIERLELLLEEAKKGDLISLIYVGGYKGNWVAKSWAMDKRNSRRQLFAELTLLQIEMGANIMLGDKDSVLEDLR